MSGAVTIGLDRLRRRCFVFESGISLRKRLLCNRECIALFFYLAVLFPPFFAFVIPVRDSGCASRVAWRNSVRGASLIEYRFGGAILRCTSAYDEEQEPACGGIHLYHVQGA